MESSSSWACVTSPGAPIMMSCAFLFMGKGTINRVEDGVAYATVTEQDAGFLAKKLPGSIMFETADLDEELQAGDKISACYMSGTIDGQTVRVVSVWVITD